MISKLSLLTSVAPGESLQAVYTKQVYTKFRKGNLSIWCKIKHKPVRQSACQAGMGVSMEEKQREKELLLQLFPKSSLIPI